MRKRRHRSRAVFGAALAAVLLAVAGCDATGGDSPGPSGPGASPPVASKPATGSRTAAKAAPNTDRERWRRLRIHWSPRRS
ncbi:hypothetical protein PV678_25695, partial [Streptomyces europaeiscabiei]|nr:hypothetical protein [Streptomyces europaeiscabiei]